MKRAQALLLMAIAILVSSCATMRRPTAYLDSTNSDPFGKSIWNVDSGYRGSTFTGNSDTSPKRAYHFSRLAAVEHCYRAGKFALLVKTYDGSKKKTYTQVSSYNYTVPGYSKFQGKTYRDRNKDQTHTNVYSYPVTLRYPIYSTLFKCITDYKSIAGKVKYEAISRELVSPFTKDFKGGLLVTSSDEKSGLKEGDVVVEVNGKRIEGYLSFSENAILNTEDGKPLKAKVIRKQKFKTVNLVREDLTNIIIAQNMLEMTMACGQQKKTEVKIPFCESVKPIDWALKMKKDKKPKKPKGKMI